jgi:hypothetical protein
MSKKRAAAAEVDVLSTKKQRRDDSEYDTTSLALDAVLTST